MSSLYLLIPLALALLGVSVWGFFDDLDSPALQILLDDDRAPPPVTERSTDA